MKWKLILVLFIGLLMVGATAGAVSAMPFKVKPQGGIGFGSYVKTEIKGSGVTGHYKLDIGWIKGVRYFDIWRIRRYTWNTVKVTYYRIPISGQYQFAIVFPRDSYVDLKRARDHEGHLILSNEYKKVEYLGPWLRSIPNSYHFKKEGWFTWRVGVEVPVYFYGKGWDAIFTVGTSMSSFGDVSKLAASFLVIRTGLKELAKKFSLSLLKQLALKSNFIGAIITIIETGLNVDIGFIYMG